MMPFYQIYNGSISKGFATSSLKLTQNQWQFIALTFDGTNAKMFLNGQQTVDTYQSYNLPTLTRSNCYIGKSAWSGDGYSSSYLDDLRFYNKSLTQSEIVQLMTMLSQNGTCREIKYIFEFEKS